MQSCPKTQNSNGRRGLATTTVGYHGDCKQISEQTFMYFY